MQDIKHLCMHCMKDLGTSDICPHCHVGITENRQDAPYLPVRTKLAERYVVGEIISSNGEGVTYIGWDINSQSAVLIREFLPLNLCERDTSTWEVRPLMGAASKFEKYLAEFLSFQKKMARMRDLSALMPVYDIFELGGTAYTVSEYTESITLNDFLIRNNGTLNYEQCRTLMMPVLTTLCSLHSAEVYHRGISPETLMIGKDGKIRIIDFCIPEARTARSDIKDQLYAGYSAIEQYGFEGQQGAWTDIYAFASVIYRILVGNAPPEAPQRATNDRLVIPAKIAETIPRHSMVALANALQFLPDERTASFERFRDEFSAAPGVVTSAGDGKKAEPSESQVTSISEEKKKEKIKLQKRSATYTILALVCTFLVITTAAVLIMMNLGIIGGDNEEPVESETVSSQAFQSMPEIDPNAVKVPVVAGYNVASAQTSCNGKFAIVVESKRYSDHLGEGLIISQDPPANSTITPNGNEIQVIKVVVSLGPENVTLPSLDGLNYEQAMLKLYEAGFSFSAISKEEKYVPDEKPGTVLSVTHLNNELVSGTSYARDTAILISVADSSSGNALVTYSEVNPPPESLEESQTETSQDSDTNQE